MKKFIVFAMLLTFGITVGFAGNALAQKVHAPKGVWGSMMDKLSDVQAMVAFLAALDMKRLAAKADTLAANAERSSQVARFPDKVKQYYRDLAASGQEVAAAAKAADEELAAEKIGAVLKVCSACHYNLRDAKRRKKALEKK